MEEYGSMNVSTSSVTSTTNGSETPGWSKGEIIGLCSGFVGALSIIVAIVACYLTHCRKSRGNGPPLSTTEEQIELNPQNTDTDPHPGNRPQSSTEQPRGLHPSNPDTSGTWDMNSCQEQLKQQYNSIGFISKHPSSTKQEHRAAVDDIYTGLLLSQDDYTRVVKERLGQFEIDKAKTKPLDSFEDLLDAEKIKELLIILSGGAGHGKSTIFKKILDTWAKRDLFANCRLLFFLELKHMKNPCIIDAILNQCFPKDKHPNRDDLIRIINANQKESVFVLDGLDELRPSLLEPKENDTFCLYNVLHNEVLRDSRVLVATRQHMVDRLLKDNQTSYALVHTEGFSSEGINQYIRKHFSDDQTKKADKLIQCLQRKEMWKNMAHIPLLCQIMCIVFSEDDELPDRKTALYRRFTEVLAKRRCQEIENWSTKLESELKHLGRVAFEALIDGKNELVFESGGHESVLDTSASGESGIIQLESYTSGLGEMTVVTFLHTTFQEYSGAYYFAHLYTENKREFQKRLKKINRENVEKMEYLLQFACGISADPPATALILEHVQKQRFSVLDYILQKVTYKMLLESRCGKLADKLDRPNYARCDSQEDLLAMWYYLQHRGRIRRLQCLRQPLVKLKDLTVHCRSHEELAPLRGIDSLLHDDTTVCIYLSINGRLHECLKLLGEILPIDNIRSIRRFRVSVEYKVSDKPDEERETPVVVDERLRDQIELTLRITGKSHIDERVLGFLSRVGKQIRTKVTLWRRTYDDVIRLANALAGCDKLIEVNVFHTNLHGHLAGVALLVPPFLKWLGLDSCGLDDDDIPDLISILPTGHGLQWLDVGGNAFSVDGGETLNAHFRNLPKLYALSLEYTGHDAERVKQVVKQNLPNVSFN